MTPTNALNRALLSLAAAGDLPRCSDPIAGQLWTAERAAHRAIAVKYCRGCPVLLLCGQAAAERDERWGVWGGVDRSTRPGKMGAA
jgi:hypothetical protein